MGRDIDIIEGMVLLVSLISYHVVSHLGCQPSPKIIEMATIALYLKKIYNKIPLSLA